MVHAQNSHNHIIVVLGPSSPHTLPNGILRYPYMNHVKCPHERNHRFPTLHVIRKLTRPYTLL